MAKMTVRARAVDMLGRQQIAGIPTAIHELFKNAHDAYADHVEIDYFREDDMLILRDDGIGMTQHDFESKWLTIGTESKLGKNRLQGYIPPNKSPRNIMGEKGIGRLAIAAIGRQVLILTRAEREDGQHDLVVALIHWSLFEIPEIDISDITIPVRSFSKGTLPTETDISSMSKEILKNLDSIKKFTPNEIIETIKNDLSKLIFSPSNLLSSLDGPESLNGKSKGTHFIITAVDEVINKDIDESGTESASSLEEVLVGFSNTMSEKVNPDRLKTKFRNHTYTESKEILENSFFTPQEFNSADHHVEGEFDEFGQFSGTVGVYGSPPAPAKIHWKGNLKSTTSCGPFKIKFAYVQGESSDTRMPRDSYNILTNKLSKIGGIYIYKDGIRVLPYGKSDNDFLEIERRRTKRAATAFFSYRLIFGSIEINHIQNENLIEKAGREGFKTNTAYRQFKEILINFFIELASTFFNKNSDDTRWIETRAQLQSEYEVEKKAIEKRKTQVKKQKSDFTKNLDNFFDAISNNQFAQKANDIKATYDKKILKLETIPDANILQDFINTKEEYSNSINNLSKSISIKKPNIGLNQELISDWKSYLKNHEKLLKETIAPLESHIKSTSNKLIKKKNISISTEMEIIESEISNTIKTSSKTNKSLKNDSQLHFNKLENDFKVRLRTSSTNLNQKIESIKSEIQSTLTDTLNSEQIVKKADIWNHELKAAFNASDTNFANLSDAVKSTISDINDNDINSLDTITALENQNEAYKSRLNQYYEFAQLGMSIGIIQHEFGSTTKSIRQAIKNLKPWAETNPSLYKLYDHIRTSYEHLDGYLTLFTPLNRRLYRSKVELSGAEIKNYVMNVFKERLNRHNISLNSTNSFDENTINTYPSVILPVFINIIDNAIHWLNFDNINNPKIELDGSNSIFTISNNGRGIDERNTQRIFEFGFSLKDSGRGMGLYISKESLEREGFDLALTSTGTDKGPKFSIYTNAKEEI